LFSSTKLSTPIIKIGGKIAEDIKMTKQAFDTLIQKMVTLQGNLCPQKGETARPFNNQVMPELSCPGAKIGGKKTNKQRKSKKLTRKLTRKLRTRKQKGSKRRYSRRH